MAGWPVKSAPSKVGHRPVLSLGGDYARFRSGRLSRLYGKYRFNSVFQKPQVVQCLCVQRHHCDCMTTEAADVIDKASNSIRQVMLASVVNDLTAI